MKKKILIGSIIAVVILVLVSFSSVVGYRSVNSDSKIESPLFRIRNEKGEVSSNYLGKGEDITIPLGPRPENPYRDMPILVKWTTAMCTYYYPIGWYCYITYGPFCRATTGPICIYITSGPVCSWITFQPGCDHPNS